MVMKVCVLLFLPLLSPDQMMLSPSHVFQVWLPTRVLRKPLWKRCDEIELVRAAYISHASTHVLMGFGTQEESNKINIVPIMRRVVLALVGHEKLAFMTTL